MNDHLAKQTGSALFWKAVQLGGVKIIFLARTLILARLLVPEDFGLLAISLIAVDFLMSVTNIGMLPALVQRLDADERQYNTAWTLGIIRALGITSTVILAAPFIAALFAEPRSTDLIRVVAVRRFSGRASEQDFFDNEMSLRQSLAAAGIETSGAAEFARYNAPWTPGFFRRNEVANA